MGVKYGDDGDNPGRYSANNDALLYAFSKMKHENDIELEIQAFDDVRTAVNIPDTLALMDGTLKAKLLEYIDEYAYLRAKAAVDLFGKYANNRYRVNGGLQSLRSILLQQVNTYVVDKIGGRAIDSLLEKSKN
jgi:hypothetical protein